MSVVLKILERLRDAVVEGTKVNLADTMLSYHVGRLASRLDEAEGLDATRVAKLEMFLLLALGDGRPTSRLFRLLEDSVDEFVQLVCTLYRATNEPKLDIVDPEKQGKAHVAHRVLEAWHGFPGRDRAPDERESLLEAWARNALTRLGAMDRAEVGASEVARVLARAPHAPDGVWPCLAARRLLESREFPGLADSLRTAMFNRRGAFTKVHAEGGAQEREIATQFRAWSFDLRGEWPRTSLMLSSIVEVYDRMAENADREAIAERAEWDEPAPLPAARRSLVARESASLVRGLEDQQNPDRILALRIRNVRTLREVDLPLSGMTVLVGENGTGKSSSLEACEILRRAAGPELE
ncbi:MAG: ATP-binding protein, partial [Polyangiaceae bacterium]|nr:ATP-binding protein [Polyangiaceae bacterium]